MPRGHGARQWQLTALGRTLARRARQAGAGATGTDAAAAQLAAVSRAFARLSVRVPVVTSGGR
ncbi:hypothetical protein GCM10010218_40080 [Streptomyces mashuensis]|uniref:Uncharacterized protein n=1 Tax=Streptomyces mashuensis TaxID=33904 RepID=A0A919B5Z2_9ACTN|nr:hypothetical protein [Streptomyces mashuensis]GHF54772.1 hypothetical protein GCM10010218_40080 [Streptomyces mashuensis]